MRTIATLHAGFLTYPPYPFIRAGRLIACLARPSAFKAARIDVFAAAKESAKQGDFRFRRRPMIDHRTGRHVDCELSRNHEPVHHFRVRRP
jgi:hypothetical protein